MKENKLENKKERIKVCKTERVGMFKRESNRERESNFFTVFTVKVTFCS